MRRRLEGTKFIAAAAGSEHTVASLAARLPAFPLFLSLYGCRAMSLRLGLAGCSLGAFSFPLQSPDHSKLVLQLAYSARTASHLAAASAAGYGFV